MQTRVVKRTRIATLVVGLSLASHAFADDLLTTVLKPYYPIVNQANHCQGVWSTGATIDDNGVTDLTNLTNLNSQNNQQKIGYCVSIDQRKWVNTSKGKRLYVLVTGDVAFDTTGAKTSGSHADSGLAGMFVLAPKGIGWQVESAQAMLPAGASGEGLRQWRLIKVAPDTWGFLNEHSDGHFGVSGGDYVILTPEGRSIRQSWIGANYSTDGMVDCDSPAQVSSAKGRVDKIHLGKQCSDLSSQFTIDSRALINDFYPLTVVVNGYHRGVIYKNQRYQLFYQPNQGYVEPSYYPLKDLDY